MKKGIRACPRSRLRKHDAALCLTFRQLLGLNDEDLQLLKQLQIAIEISRAVELLSLKDRLHHGKRRGMSRDLHVKPMVFGKLDIDLNLPAQDF